MELVHALQEGVRQLFSGTHQSAGYGHPRLVQDRIEEYAEERSIDVAPTASFLLDIPVPQHSQGQVMTPFLRGDNRYKIVNLIGLNDFHGQLEPSTMTPIDSRTFPVGGAADLATMFDEEAAAAPWRDLLLAAGDNVGASPPNSALLDDAPAIDVENVWGMDATSYGNHEFDFGVERILEHLDRADFPFLSTNIVEDDTRRPPPWLDRSAVFNVNGVRVGVIGATVRTTPELVRADATEGLEFLDEAKEIAAGVRPVAEARRPGPGRGHPRGRRARQQPRRLDTRQRVAGPDHADRRAAPEERGRPRHRRPHPSHRQHRRRAHPDRRGRQRGWQLLGRPTA